MSDSLPKLPTPTFARTMVQSPSGGVIFISEKEKFLCDTYLATGGNINRCAVALREKYRTRTKYDTVKRWLSSKPGIMAYLKDRISRMAEFESLDEVTYTTELLRMAKTDRKVAGSTVEFWRIVGRVKGFGEGKTGGITLNQQINFKQANGDD